jgi:hypothetical protein
LEKRWEEGSKTRDWNSCNIIVAGVTHLSACLLHRDAATADRPRPPLGSATARSSFTATSWTQAGARHRETAPSPLPVEAGHPSFSFSFH